MSFFLTIFKISPVFAQIKVPTGIPVGGKGILSNVLSGLIALLLLIAFVLALIYLLLGGISWITSGGNKEALAAAKKRVTYAILGLSLALLSFTILYFFGDLFGLNLRRINVF